ncbi:hypothetical protein [Streptomyces pseudovenezuelae]|uniref:DUF3592 domain-containing protein n=1 Tax=Streptomyces pseudovenezuelae TaxID=67350 RepID=A0ABT6LQ68_9ACTN|nr:hypothetical protein [Streptomyces pseudovenezuelae]MDH6218465.1 hypothetical protein [Streptomyces pseudovenezuelae]
MEAWSVLPALFAGLGLGFLWMGLRAGVTALRLRVRGLRAIGVVTAWVPVDGRLGGVVVFCDHLGRAAVLDPGRYGSLCGLPPVGERVPVVYVRNRPASARLWDVRHLLAPAFGWFLSSTVAFGTSVVVSP